MRKEINTDVCRSPRDNRRIQFEFLQFASFAGVFKRRVYCAAPGCLPGHRRISGRAWDLTASFGHRLHKRRGAHAYCRWAGRSRVPARSVGVSFSCFRFPGSRRRFVLPQAPSAPSGDGSFGTAGPGRASFLPSIPAEALSLRAGPQGVPDGGSAGGGGRRDHGRGECGAGPVAEGRELPRLMFFLSSPTHTLARAARS